jgi:predicted ATPase
MDAFERVSTGTAELMLVSGYSGIGKSCLVYEVHKPIVGARGYFIAGKFDQFKRNISYGALIQAFEGLIRQILTESSEKINLWRYKILNDLGQNTRVIIDIIPEADTDERYFFCLHSQARSCTCACTYPNEALC